MGSNLGDRESFLFKAIGSIDKQIGFVLKKSALFETEPWGFETNNKFLNMVVELETSLLPEVVLKECLSIEAELGRIRGMTEGYSSRTIDIDILFYDDLVLSTEELIVPHPHIQNRRFILAPMCDVAPEFMHPVLNKSIKFLLEECDDDGQVKNFGYLDA